MLIVVIQCKSGILFRSIRTKTKRMNKDNASSPRKSKRKKKKVTNYENVSFVPEDNVTCRYFHFFPCVMSLFSINIFIHSSRLYV